MPKNDDADTPISIRVPKELRQQIKDYAEANKLYRAGSANLSGALILIAREFLAGNVAQSSADLDVGITEQLISDIKTEIYKDMEERITELDEHYSKLFNTVQDRITTVTTTATPDIEATVNYAIAPLLTRLEALENTRSEAAAPANFTQALLQKAIAVAPLKLMKLAIAA